MSVTPQRRLPARRLAAAVLRAELAREQGLADLLQLLFVTRA